MSSPATRPTPADVGAYELPAAVAAEDTALTPAQQRWLARHWRVIATVLGLVLGGRASACVGPLALQELAPRDGAVVDSLAAFRAEVRADRVAQLRADSARETAVVAALTAHALVLCEVVPPARARTRGFPCRRLQDGERWPLYGGLMPPPPPPAAAPPPALVAFLAPRRWSPEPRR